MSYRSRLTAAGLSAAVTAGTLVGIAAPAGAAVASFAYTCTGSVTQVTLVPAVPPLPPVPISTPVPVTAVAVPLLLSLPDSPPLSGLAPGQAVPEVPVAGSLDVGWLLTALTGTLQTVSATLPVSLAGLDAPLSLPLASGAPLAVGSLVGGQLPLSGTIPAFTAPAAPGDHSITMPSTLSIQLADVTADVPTTDTLTCTLVPGAASLLTTVVVVSAPGTGGTGGTGSTGGTGGTGTGTSTPTYNDCTRPLTHTASQRRSRLTASAPRATSSTRRPPVSVSVRSRHRPARGRVVACRGSVEVGEAMLRRGKTVLRIKRMRPGRYRIAVRYLGAQRVRPQQTVVMVRTKR